MSHNRKTVKQLAFEAKLEPEEALVKLWYGDFNYLQTTSDLISTRELNRARRVLGLGTRREIKSVEYWSIQWGLTEENFRKFLAEFGIDIDPNAKNLPKRSVSIIRKEAKKKGVGPIAGTELKKGEGYLSPTPRLEWEILGREKEVFFLSTEEVKNIHETLALDFALSEDPIFPSGVKDETLLESAVFRPSTSLGKTQKYPTVEMAAAALLHSLTHNHAFHNGNKRTALVSMLVFLDENGYVPTCNENDLFELMLKLAGHGIIEPDTESLSDQEVLFITRWLMRNIRPLDLKEYVMNFRRLKQVLASFGCVINFADNKVKITRTIEEKGFFGKTKSTLLTTTVFYGGDGREIGKRTLKKIRDELRLDDRHGYDSMDFYRRTNADPGEFIHKYRKTLMRLGKL